jgi:hypothetical protein
MNRRNFLTSILRSAAVVAAVHVGLGNVLAEDVVDIRDSYVLIASDKVNGFDYYWSEGETFMESIPIKPQ